MTEQVVFIDSRVPDIQDLLNGLQPGEQAFVIDSSSDGIQQVADILAENNLTDLSSISIVSHGESGALELGSSFVTDANLAAHSNALAEIGASLAPGGAIQLYGCDVALGAGGQQFVNDFSALAGGAAVEAATHIVGSAALGGSWTLDASSNGANGAANTPFTPAALANFQGDLAAPVQTELWVAVTGGGPDNEVFHVDDTGSGTGTNATTLFTPTSTNNPASLTQLSDIALDTQNNRYFLVEDQNGDGSNTPGNNPNVIWAGTLSSALSNPTATPALTSIYSNGGGVTVTGEITGIALDAVNQDIYFTQQHSLLEVGYTGGTVTTLSTGDSNTFLDGLALDLPHNQAFFFSVKSTSTSSGGTTEKSTLWIDSDLTTNTAPTQLPFSPQDAFVGGNAFPVSLGQIAGIAVDTVNERLYFTTDPVEQPDLSIGEGGIYEYDLTNNTAGTYTALWVEPSSSSLALTHIDVDPATGKYYVSDVGESDVNPAIYDGSLTVPGDPTLFTTVGPGGFDLAPQGLALDNAPTLALTAATPTWTEDGASVSLITSAAATDSDNTSLVSATVSITGGLRSGDTLTFANVAGISGSYNSSTGVLTFSGVDSLAGYQTELQSVQYHGGENPTDFSRTDTSRTLTWAVNDGLLTSAPQTSSVSVIFVNDPPTLSGLTTASWTEEGPAAALSPAASVSDPDDLNLSSATVAITGGTFVGDSDVLTANTTGTAIAASYNSTTETLTLSGTDTLAHYKQVLDSVTFSAAENPTDFGADPTRTVAWTLTDPSGTANGGSDTSTATTTINVTSVNDPPTLTNVAASASYTEEGPFTTLSGAVTVTDPDDLNLSSATVKIAGGTFAGDGDVLAAMTAGTSIAAAYNSTTETLTLTGADTLAHYQSVLDSVTFHAGENPTDFGSNATRTITWQVQDPSGTANGGSDTSALSTTTLAITNVNDAPTLALGSTVASWTEEQASPTSLAAAATVSDPDNVTLASAMVAITGGTFAGDSDVLAATTTGTSITASYNTSTETLTLSGSDSLADYQAVLNSITFQAGENPTDFGADPTRTLTWTLNDGGASNNLSAPQSTTINITNVNDPPTLANVAANAQYTEEGGAVTLSNAIAVTDADDRNLSSATVKITGGTFAGDADVLAANTAGTAITASYNSATETLTLTGTDTLAHYQAVLDSVTFQAGENPTNFGSDPTRTITWQAMDPSGTANGGSDTSTPATTTVAVTNVNDPPTLSNVAASATFTQGHGAVTLSTAASASDPDNLDLVAATVAITGGTFVGDGDVLAANVTGTAIVASYNSATETLALTGFDTLAHYSQVLDSVTFNSTSGNPTDFGADPTRTVSWVVNDGSGSFNLSSAQTETVNIVAVNQSPTLTGVAASASFTEENPATTLSGNVTVSDPDDTMLAGATVSITGGKFAGDGDVLATSTAGTSITASYNSSTETLTLSGADTLADYQSVLDKVTFSAGENPNDYGSNPTRTITWVLNDGHASNNLSTAQTETLNITNVNDPPTLANVAATVGFLPHHTITISPSIAVSDPDNLTLANATVRITAGTFAGDGDVLAANVSGTSITASYNSATETLTLTGSDTLAHYQSVLDSVTFASGNNPQNGNHNRTRTVTWTVNDGGSSNNLATATTTITIPPSNARNDFNGDGNSDLLFQNASVQHPDVMVELLNGTTIASSATITTPRGTEVVAAADFNSDAKSDIVVQASDGTPQIWLMNGTSVTSTVTLADPGSSWHVISAADFNSDGNSDLLFQNSDGSTAVWLMNGTSVVSMTTVGNPGVSWHAIRAADFNGDGNADILFQNDDGTPMIWEMNGASIVAQATLTNPGKFWHAVGTGDFNGDGDADILFQNKDGTPLIWEMNGTSIVTQATLTNPGVQLHAIGTGDFNGDGMSDILYQNTNGTPVIWEMNGTSVASTFTTANPGSQWVLQDDGPIPASQMGSGGNSGGGTMRQSAPDGAIGVAASGSLLAPGSALAAPLQSSDQHLTSGRA